MSLTDLEKACISGMQRLGDCCSLLHRSAYRGAAYVSFLDTRLCITGGLGDNRVGTQELGED